MKEATSGSAGLTKEERFASPAYVWIDTEFTGLDTSNARLLQVAMVLTDTRLRRLAPPERDVCLCIRVDEDTPISDWVAQNLAGLLARCRAADACGVADADRILAQRMDELLGPASSDVKRRPVLAGNTVHMDAALVRRFLPEFTRRLHYRLLDVSTLKILWNDLCSGRVFDKGDAGLIRDFMPAGFVVPPAAEHDAYYDIHATLAEMNYYLKGFAPVLA